MNNHKLSTRIFSIVLALVLVLGMLPAATLAADTVAIYFDNTANWSTVNIYYWSDSDTGMVTWPGTAMKPVEGTIYSFDIPADAGYVIFNNGSDQTSDLPIPTDGKNLYVYSSNSWSTYVDENACAHSWGEGSVSVAATCTTNGKKVYTCSKCAETKTEILAATGHNYVNDTCTTCGEAKPTDYVVYFDNTNTGWSTPYVYTWTDSTEYTGTWPGSTMELVEGSIYTFTVPVGAVNIIFSNGSGDQTGDLTIPTDGKNLYNKSSDSWSVYVNENACAHEWGEGTVTLAATCTTAGKKTYTCSKCAETKNETIAAIGHNYVNNVCTTCGTVKPNDHQIFFDNTNTGWSKPYVYTWTDSTEYTGTWPGSAMEAVSGVANLFCITVPAGAENIIFSNGDGDQTSDMTIPTDGKNLYNKSTDSWSLYETCNHNWGTGSVTTEPTCTADGVRTYTCSNCGKTKTESIPTTGHSYVDGKCSVCGMIEGCTDHKWDDGVVTEANTCWTPGTMTYTCTLCGETKEEIIYPGHDLYDAEISREPTCTRTGNQKRRCKNCTAVYDKTLPALGHSYKAGSVVAATCTTDGYTVYTCDNCGESENRDIVYHTGHKFSGNTCSTCGTVCAHTYVDGICSKCSNGGPAYVEGVYEIANAAQLKWFASKVNGGDNAINGKLIADINLNGATWTSIGTYCPGGDSSKSLFYKGTFDGNGHTVSNFTVAGNDSVGLFGYAEMATIKNLGVINATATGANAGAVVGYAATSTVINCYAKDCTLTGYTTNPIALNSRRVHVGAIAGEGSGYVYNCYAVNCKLVDKTGDMTIPAGETYRPWHEFYAAPLGGNGSSISNNFYNSISGTFSSTNGATEVTTAQLASGEITYLLNKGVTDGTQAWYQTCGVGMPAHSGKTVYQLTACGGTDATYTNDANATGTHDAGSWVVVKEATATETGLKELRCTACGTVLRTEVIPVLAAPTLTLKYPTVSFEDEIIMNIFFAAENLGDITPDKMGLITFSSEVADGTVENADAVIPGAELNAAAGFYCANTKGIAAKNLGDKVYFRAYVQLADGSYVYSNMANYSPMKYAYSVLNGNYGDDMKALVAAMLNYGAAAQVYFNHNTDALVNADMTDAHKALVKAYSSDMIAPVVKADSAKAANFVNNGGFSRRYPSISFESAFSINYFFAPAYSVDGDITLYYWTTADYNSADVLTTANATGSVVATAGTEYEAAVKGIAAKNLDGTIYVAAVYTSNGTTYGSGVLAYSIGAYCLDRITNGSASMQSFASATAVYGYYAKAYFAK